MIVEHMYLHLAIRYFSILANYSGNDENDTNTTVEQQQPGQSFTQRFRGLCCEYVNGLVVGAAAKSLKIHLVAGFAPGEIPTPQQEQEFDAWRPRTRT